MRKHSNAIPYQHLAQGARRFAIHKLLGVRQLEVHIRVGRHEVAVILGLVPLEAHDDVLVDPAQNCSQLGPSAAGWDAKRGRATYRDCSIGFGLNGAMADMLGGVRRNRWRCVRGGFLGYGEESREDEDDGWGRAACGLECLHFHRASGETLSMTADRRLARLR